MSCRFKSNEILVRERFYYSLPALIYLRLEYGQKTWPIKKVTKKHLFFIARRYKLCQVKKFMNCSENLFYRVRLVHLERDEIDFFSILL